MMAVPRASIGLFLTGFTEDSFRRIHSFTWFDYCVLIPYFTVLAIFSLYGIHRYAVIAMYMRQRSCPPHKPPPLRTYPSITIQLPLYNEKFMVERLLNAVALIQYPRERLQIQVLDDSTDETSSIAPALVEYHRGLGLPIEYHHRATRAGFKAGALQDGLQTATGELIAIFDADFVPPADFLQRAVPYFADPLVGVVQTRWSFINRHQGLLTKVQGLLLDAHFALEHASRSANGIFFNFNGTGGILRRAMIQEAGGWQADTLTEDADLSYRAQVRGWRFVYTPDIDCPSELPADMHSFQCQQFRWCKGLTQVARKILPVLLRSRIPLRQKVQAFFYLTPTVCNPLTLVLAALVVPAAIIRFSTGWVQMVFVDLPLICTSFLPVSLFYVVGCRQLHPESWRRSIFLLPALMAIGIGLAMNNSRAFCEGLFGVPSEFVRTPKYATADPRAAASHPTRKAEWLAYLEIVAGAYFAAAIAYALSRANYGSVPFLSLFLSGFLGTGVALFDQHSRRSKLIQSQRRSSEPIHSGIDAR